MKYYDQTPARNTKNGEVYKLKSLGEAVLLTRGVILDAVEAYARIAELEAALKDVLYGGPGEGYVSSSEPDSCESRCARAEKILARTI